MILTENNVTMIIDMDLMRENHTVAQLRLEISSFSAYIDVLAIDKEDLLPEIILNNKLGIQDYLVSRCLPMRNHRNIYLIRLVIHGETRHKMMPLLLSLSTNSVSLSDKYWLNPKETTELILNGAKILFKRKQWHEVDPFKNSYMPGELEQYGLCDSFFIDRTELMNPHSLIWSTSGSQNKRWLHDDSGYYLEKKLYKNQMKDELDTIDFFSSNNIMVPMYNLYTQELNDATKAYEMIYSLDTIREGLHVIQKRCLTSSTSYLEKLSDYLDNDVDVESPMIRMFTKYHIDESEAKRFISIINSYQKQFNVSSSLLDTRNIGLLVEKDNVIPVVWGRLNRNRLWTGQLEC